MTPRTIMTPKQYVGEAKRAKRDRRGLAELVALVPTDAFVQMVAKSGLPTSEARELCAAFKRLKNDDS